MLKHTKHETANRTIKPVKEYTKMERSEKVTRSEPSLWEGKGKKTVSNLREGGNSERGTSVCVGGRGEQKEERMRSRLQ